MNNMLKSLLVTALAISASHVSAYTNRNFLSSPRPQNASLLLDSAVAHDLARTNKQDRFGGNFMVRGFYSESNKGKELGKFFGIQNKDNFKSNIGNAATLGDLNLGLLIHDGLIARNNAVHGVTINLAPKTVSYGVEFGYVQCLSKILDGLHLSVSLPVERVENNMNLSVANNFAAADTKVVTDFFAGTLAPAANAASPFPAGTANGSGQVALKNALINGKQSATGIADIDVVLGYDFIRNEDWTAGLNIGLSIPTGNSASGKYVFEPVYGNGAHWELGFGGKVAGKLWQDGDQHIGLNVQADYRYGFQANETRTLSGKDDWSKYYLAGATAGVADRRAYQFIPVANASTVAVSVTPNSALRGNLGLNYGNGGLVLGLAYAPAWKQAESVKFNGSFAADGATAILHPTTDNNQNNAFSLANVGTANIDGANGGALVAINKADLSMDSVTRPSQLSHRIGGDLGYTFKEWEFPVTIGAGAHYEFASDNASIENWGVNLSAGIGF